MESDIRESRRAEAGQARTMSGEKSPAGSVKRARQRAAAGKSSPQPQIPSNPTPPSVRSPTHSPQQVMSPHERTHHPQYSPQDLYFPGSPPAGARRPNVSVTSPTGSQDASRSKDPGAMQDQNVGRRLAPQRPPRPNYVPPLPGSSQFHANQPQPLQYRTHQSLEQPPRNYWEDSFNEPSTSSRPLTTSTSSTASSTVSIPDFPSIPAMPPAPLFQPPPRRNLGPPPSARKGGSSYYSQQSFVPPIPEEMSETHSSYASSQVMGESWADGPPQYYMGGGIDEEDDDYSQGGNSGRGSSAGDHDDASGLVRKGSQGKPRTPFLETVDSEDESERGSRGMRELDWQNRQDERWRMGAPGTDPIGRHNFRGDARLNPQLYSGYESDLQFLDSPRTQSPMPNLNPNSQSGALPYFRTPSPSGSLIDPRVGQIMDHLEKGGALASSGTASPSRSPSVNEKESKRPPRLNLGAPKEGPGRGSATSLPELIRRATKLASNLDRGKTASRVGMLDLLNAKEKESREKAAKGDGSISDILAAFPSPSPTTPTAHKPSGWPTPSPRGKSALSRAQTPGYGSSVSRQTERRRKCCGMPVWAFVLLIIILLLLVAAAVIIPITLVVIPHNHKNNSPDVSDCESSLPCGNGGTSVVVNKKCRCICSNGYLGSSCNTPADPSCTSIDVPGASPITTYRRATLGDSIPRIFNAAQSNFSIPISSYTVLSLFSVANLTCASENALVTFGQKAQRRDTAQLPLPLALEVILSAPTKTHRHSSRILHARASAQTTNGIIFAAPSVDTGGGTAPATSTAGAVSPSSSNSNQKPITQRVLDFSRTAVLFIFQETSSLQITQTALDRLQATLSGGSTFDATQTSAGVNITVDLAALTVGFGNGTFYGGKGTS